MRAVLILKSFSKVDVIKQCTKLRFCSLLVFTFLQLSSIVSVGQEKTLLGGELSVIPVVFYTPETSFGFGAASIYTVQIDSNALNSQVQLGFAYTTSGQILSYVSGNVFTEKFRYSGELGFYRYTYKFFGIGNDVPFAQEEDYTVRYPRVRLEGLRNFGSFSAGLAFVFDAFKTIELEEGGLLDSGVPGALGASYLGLGPSLVFDTRDNSLFPRKGVLAQLKYLVHPDFGEPYFGFNKLWVDVAKYFSLNKKSVLAVQAGFEGNRGDVPFYQLAGIGGTKVLRGYYEDRFRGHYANFVQSEYRFLPKRIGFTLFASAGMVASTIGTFAIDHTQFTYGAGFRYKLTKKDNLNIRVDVGLTPQGTSNFYFTFLEAF